MSAQIIDPRLGLSNYTTLPPPHPVEQNPALPLPPRPTLTSHQQYPGYQADTLRQDATYTNARQNAPPYCYPSSHMNSPQRQQQQHPNHQPQGLPATPVRHPGVSSLGSASNQASPDLTHRNPPSDAQEGSPDQHDDGGVDGANGDDPKRPRACEACRGLKVRCDQDPALPDVPCKRCAKANRPCVITQPSRKRQKKADTRVAELEKKLDALTAALHQQQGGHAQAGAGAPMAELMSGRNGSSGQYSQAFDEVPVEGKTGGPVMAARKRKRIDDEATVYDSVEAQVNAHLSRATSTSGNAEDPVRKHFTEIENSWAPTEDSKRFLYHTTPEEFIARVNSFINPELAATIFDRYVTTLSPHLPAVVFPPNTTSEQIFKDKPILYVSILSAASFGMLSPDTSKALAREAVGAIADCVVRNGAKSLELIQAMHVMALWYKPPEKAEQTNFYQIIHMAAVMALDIGLGKRFNPAKARRGFGGPNAQFAPGPGQTIMPQDSDTLEARRAWLGCYYLCASASMVLRRPNLIRWTNYMKECIEVLESHPDAYPSDKLFCQHVKLQHICEDIGLQFLMDDNTATISITDPKVTYALNVLENQLKDWKKQVPEDLQGPGLQFFEHVTSLYLHEIALHFNHNIEDFRLPFTEESLKSVNNTSDTLTQNQMAALEACLRAAQGILDTMLAYEKDVIKSLPMLLFFVRCVYAIVILIKMHVAVCTPGSELGKMMQPEELKVEYYIDCLITLFGHGAKEGEDFRPHPKILRILTVLREWFGKHKENVLALAQAKGHGSGHKGKVGGTARVGKGRSGSGRVKEAERERERMKVELGEAQIQTPLHLLSQVATGGAQGLQLQQRHPSQQQLQQQQGQLEDPTNWSFSAPLLDYARQPPPGHPDNRLPRWDQNTHSTGVSSLNNTTVLPSTAQTPLDNNNTAYPTMDQQQQQYNMAGLLPLDQDFGGSAWGNGFEQAMDIALSGVDGLQGGGLDTWFLGDSMGPFSFPNGMGDGVGGQW
ncbi:hypothetical protein LTR91_016289 [Friedmanniomyces endolithicus]|uniref:Zn(2)-C6 fungal-type domain-containing protein n=1 Tax=Friedmanniomyces endolithicus TaxID=329885 RepID=A0AAN6K8S9_9PEZI|nr:hypothetical protein LTR57_020171 [Friedmanniomyces endolithicus]KAK0969518.1 hypothetical protein LTR91_016289 [Friedmanniomyces endolithicus]KAK1031645.1 hypothetical protein LTS16_017870 [Friedmanniomyces endolithicus]